LLVHHRRGLNLLPSRRVRGTTTEPHREAAYPKWLSLVKLVYLFIDFSAGWLLNVRPFLRRGGWVIAQRNWWDLQVDPRRYRIHPMPRVARTLGYLLPRPDLVLLLEASPVVIARRKDELPEDELIRQMRAWREVLPTNQRVASIDAGMSERMVAQEAASSIERTLGVAGRSRTRERWTNLPVHGTPRWILPTGNRRVARASLRVHNPMTWRGSATWHAARGLAALGALRLIAEGAAPPDEVMDVLAPHIPSGGAVAVARANHPGRFVALLLDRGGSCTGVAKVASDRPGGDVLRKEGARLSALGPLLPSPLSAPRVLATQDRLLLLEPISWLPRRQPWRLPDEVARALGEFYRAGADGQAGPSGLAHGDCAPWNLLRSRDGWWLVDWEEAREDAPPFFDLCHFLVQGYGMLGRPLRETVQGGLRGEGWVGSAVRAYAAGAQFSSTDARASLVSYLEWRVPRLDSEGALGSQAPGARRRIRELASDVSSVGDHR
jgi:hypothetical protein